MQGLPLERHHLGLKPESKGSVLSIDAMIPAYFAVFLLLVGNTVSLNFAPCEDGEGEPPNLLLIYDCRIQPCVFTAGGNVLGSLNVSIGEESADLDGEMTVDHNGSLITFPVQGVHRCDGLEREGCHFESGDTARFYYMFLVHVEIPEEEVTSFKMVIKNEKGTPLSCCIFNAKIVSKGTDGHESKGTPAAED